MIDYFFIELFNVVVVVVVVVLTRYMLFVMNSEIRRCKELSTVRKLNYI